MMPSPAVTQTQVNSVGVDSRWAFRVSAALAVDWRWALRACAVLVAGHQARSLLASFTTSTSDLPRELSAFVGGPVPWGYGFHRFGVLFQGIALLLSISSAACFVLGRGARIASVVLLCVSLELYWANYLLVRLDDYVVNLTCMLLCAMPVAKASARRGLAAYGWVMLAATTWLHLALAFNLVAPSTSPLLRAAMCAACALPWLEARWLRVSLGVFTGLAYCGLAARSDCWLAVTLMAFLQAAGLCAIHVAKTAGSPDHDYIGAPSLGISALLLLVALHGLALGAQLPGLAFRTGRVVALLGLSWPGAYLFHPFERSALTLVWATAAGVKGHQSVESTSEETLGFCLRASFAGTAGSRQFAADHFASQVCRRVERGPGELAIEWQGKPVARVWFDCAHGRAATAVQLAQTN